MNEKANEAAGFLSFMANSLKEHISVKDPAVRSAVENHIKFMQKDMEIDANGFAAQSKFLMSDDFHRSMMEQQQTGLSYYICFAAESFAAG
jgi:Zn-dependent peptidase ImmA (M78 family)